MKAPTTLTCPNGHQWVLSSSTLLVFRGRTGLRWVRIPVELFRVVLGERRAQPTPILYLMAAGAGVVLGLLLDLAVDWAWWLVATGFLLLVWLFFSHRPSVVHRTRSAIAS